MRYSFLLITILYCLSSCKFNFESQEKKPAPFAASDANDKKLKKVMGEWIIIETQTEASNRDLELLVENELAAYKEYMELNPFAINADGSLYTGATSHTNKLAILRWQFLPPNIIEMPDSEPPSYFEILRLDKDTLYLYATLPVNEKAKGEVRVLHKLYRIESRKVGGINIFNDSINWWREQPARTESRQEIAERLKAMLQYNYVYIRSLYYAKAPVINTKKFNMPFRYYNGGLALKNEMDSNDSFVDFFYTKEEALIALGMLRDAFPKVEYKRKANYTLEYADYMKGLADVVK